jgi:hypothetical protein
MRSSPRAASPGFGPAARSHPTEPERLGQDAMHGQRNGAGRGMTRPGNPPTVPAGVVVG